MPPPESGGGISAVRKEAAATVLVATEPSGPVEAGSAAEEPEQREPTADELPPLEDLVKRISPEVLAAMDELFRAKWTGVRRLRAGDLKNG